ncbi:unnamed protein product [Prorocentrum cordatum]|uniref:Uncharacterized protein n=1 Tax=Prorocentrum cordatum TaxID=2364126 RepID=A0ABN9S3T0_9DINO|nr:unnamed protein product [Polarella glacialis]
MQLKRHTRWNAMSDSVAKVTGAPLIWIASDPVRFKTAASLSYHGARTRIFPMSMENACQTAEASARHGLCSIRLSSVDGRRHKLRFVRWTTRFSSRTTPFLKATSTTSCARCREGSGIFAALELPSIDVSVPAGS